MRSANAPRLDIDEIAHLADVKSLRCSCCGRAGPSIAHHLTQRDHFTTIPLCEACHTGSGGIHGDQSTFKLRGLTERKCLNWTIRMLRYGTERIKPRTTRSALSSSKIVPNPLIGNAA